MAWIGAAHGIFRLHDSDRWCGSYLSLADASEVLGVPEIALDALPLVEQDGERCVDELTLHRAWGSGAIASPFPNRIGSAARSLDELILTRLITLVWPDAVVEPQVPFGRKRVDLAVTVDGRRVFVEFVGPGHFIPQYQRPLVSPLVRKAEVEAHFGDECVIWPFWLQRCERNVRVVFNPTVNGLAAVWSTKALFGDFVAPDAANLIMTLTERFHAVASEGLGYMYLAERTPNKPVHPIIPRILDGRERVARLIPPGDQWGARFWVPDPLVPLVTGALGTSF